MDIEERLSNLPIKKSKYAEALKPDLNEIIRQAKFNETEREEQKYLESLANRYVSGKPKSYHWARSIVMDVHISLEFYMNSIIRLMLIFGTAKVGLPLIEPKQLMTEIQKIDYVRKVEIIKPLGVFSGDSIKIFFMANDVRKAFAHGRDMESKDYNYGKESIFEKTTIEKLIHNQQTILHEFSRFLVKAGILERDKKKIGL